MADRTKHTDILSGYSSAEDGSVGTAGSVVAS